MKNFLAIFTLSFSLFGCASMFGDNTRQISVKSNPSGASVYLDGINYGKTPTTVTLPSYIYGGKSLVMKKSGYQDTGILINSKFQLVGLLNLFFPPIGFGIDGITGNMMKIDPSQLNVEVSMSAK